MSMVEYHKAPKLEKPTALRNYLLDKRYTILTTTIPVGNIVEYGLDWVVDMLNTFNEGVADAFNYHETRLKFLDDKTSILLSDLNTLKVDFQNLDCISLGEYYDLKFTHDCEILDKIKSKTDPIEVDLATIDEKYKVWIERLVEIVGDIPAPGTSISVSLVNLGDRISAVEAEFGGRKNLFQWTWLLFSDPPLFAYELFDEVITRFW